MKKTLESIFEKYGINNAKGELVPLLESELGKDLFLEVYEFINSNNSKVINSISDQPVKITWEKTDTFATMHKKLLGMIGTVVMNKQNENEPYVILEVSDICETSISGIGGGFIKFLEGDVNYSMKDGSYNFKGMKTLPMWVFTVKYGTQEDHLGRRTITSYNFMIPKNDTYENDSKNFMRDENHPFVFFEI